VSLTVCLKLGRGRAAGRIEVFPNLTWTCYRAMPIVVILRLQLEPKAINDHAHQRVLVIARSALLAVSAFLWLPLTPPQAQTVSAGSPTLNTHTKLSLTNTDARWVDYRGRRAFQLAPLPGHEHGSNEEMVAVLDESDFHDGTIEIDVAGARRAGYSTTEDTSGFKGFVGISFRIDGKNAERFYLRPENARLDNQEFRNRSTQYESDPDYPWRRLRKDSPGVYESYVDLEPGAWTSLKIEVSGAKARLFVNGAPQPCLVVNDLKHGDSRGKIALWTHVSSAAYFSNLKVRTTS
jgi:hypothetical protein